MPQRTFTAEIRDNLGKRKRISFTAPHIREAKERSLAMLQPLPFRLREGNRVNIYWTNGSVEEWWQYEVKFAPRPYTEGPAYSLSQIGHRR